MDIDKIDFLLCNRSLSDYPVDDDVTERLIGGGLESRLGDHGGTKKNTDTQGNGSLSNDRHADGERLSAMKARAYTHSEEAKVKNYRP